MTDLSHDEEVGALYALRPGEFVAARDALAKRLRGEGRRAEADAVKALGRPTVAAWAVNQLSRVEPEWTQALANAGRRLEEAQEALFERGDRAGWREATVAQREAVERLLGLAERLLRDERGAVSNALREQVRGTLQAASVDAEARAAVCRGRLERELHPAGLLGAGAAEEAPAGEPDEAPAPAPKRTTSSRTPKRERDGDREEPSAAEVRRARTERRAAERDARAALRRAERLVTAARAAAERTAKAEARARKAHDAAADALADAQEAEAARAQELAKAESAAEDAAEALAERQAAERAARETLEALDD